MAGGQNKPGTGLPKWLLRANADRRAAALEAMAQRRPERQVHCWVAGTDGPFPGLALDWRREGAGWVGLAVWATGSGDMVSGWVDAEALSPVADQTDAPAP